MHKKIVSTCSPNNNMHWLCIQYIVKKIPDGYFTHCIRSNACVYPLQTATMELTSDSAPVIQYDIYKQT